jgi:hypothetical protein
MVYLHFQTFREIDNSVDQGSGLVLQRLPKTLTWWGIPLSCSFSQQAAAMRDTPEVPVTTLIIIIVTVKVLKWRGYVVEDAKSTCHNSVLLDTEMP